MMQLWLEVAPARRSVWLDLTVCGRVPLGAGGVAVAPKRAFLMLHVNGNALANPFALPYDGVAARGTELPFHVRIAGQPVIGVLGERSDVWVQRPVTISLVLLPEDLGISTMSSLPFVLERVTVEAVGCKRGRCRP